tara:strand:- start:609 stop:1100 length:492 start_codon:yes stop_codon:yes gene_type:complete
MSIGFWQFAIVLILFSPTLVALILCLILIKNKEYKKLSKNHIYAGFWYRCIAGLIDWILLSIISIILIFIPIIGWIFSFFVYWLYFAIQHSSSKQATLGMRALEIKISDEKHNKIGFWRASGNYFVSSLSAFLLFIGFFMIGFTSRKQGLHNFISRTLYIKTK